MRRGGGACKVCRASDREFGSMKNSFVEMKNKFGGKMNEFGKMKNQFGMLLNSYLYNRFIIPYKFILCFRIM